MTNDLPVHRLDASQVRRLVGRLCLRPGERILLLGNWHEVVARLAAYLVGPDGEVVEAGYDVLPPGGSSSPFADGEFDAVLAGVATTIHPEQLSVLAEAGRVTAPTGRWPSPSYRRMTATRQACTRWSRRPGCAVRACSLTPARALTRSRPSW